MYIHIYIYDIPILISKQLSMAFPHSQISSRLPQSPPRASQKPWPGAPIGKHGWNLGHVENIW